MQKCENGSKEPFLSRANTSVSSNYMNVDESYNQTIPGKKANCLLNLIKMLILLSLQDDILVSS